MWHADHERTALFAQERRAALIGEAQRDLLARNARAGRTSRWNTLLNTLGAWLIAAGRRLQERGHPATPVAPSLSILRMQQR